MEINPMLLTIHNINESELNIIYEIDQELFIHDFYNFNNWISMFQNPNYEIVSLKYANQIVGFLCLLNNIDNVEIIRIGIKKTYQGKHLGQYLLNYAFKNQKPILLEVSSRNQKAIQLYLKSGFIEIGRRNQYYQDGSDAIIMQKRASNY